MAGKYVFFGFVGKPPIGVGQCEFDGGAASSWDVNENAFVLMAYHNNSI